MKNVKFQCSQQNAMLLQEPPFSSIPEGQALKAGGESHIAAMFSAFIRDQHIRVVSFTVEIVYI